VLKFLMHMLTLLSIIVFFSINFSFLGYVISFKLHTGLIQYCYVTENSSIFHLPSLQKIKKEQTYDILILSAFPSHFELWQHVTDITQILVWKSWHLKQH
jgi:hypothetical protein